MEKHELETVDGVRVYVPTGAINARPQSLAPRLQSLNGARIGILDNCKEFADIVLRGVADVLHHKHGIADVKFWQKAYLGIASPYALDMATQCDAVINGVGH
ncbi:MAG: hypothetical protein OEN48_12165 [Betaproteobacteria bacterium]|nr:hypothetical protein [Gammaproteobacteria bacterium]MDH3437728.1 hypothetical protein [Betaproteobacteria bacterium]